MKKFLSSLVILIVTVFIVQFALYFALKQFLDAKSQFRVTRYFRSPQHKYFVLGNSRGVNSIDEKYAVEKCGIDIMNLSFNAEPYKNILSMLDEINSRNTGSTIFIEMTCLNNNDFDNSYAYYISNSKYIKDQFAGTVYSVPTLLRMNNELFLRNFYYLGKSDNDWGNMKTITVNMIDQIKLDPGFKIFPNTGKFVYRLSELQKRCNDHGNKIIFFLAPYYPGYLSKVLDYNTVINYMTQNKEYAFLNLNTVKLSDDMFADRIHTNAKGAILLTKGLISLIK